MDVDDKKFNELKENVERIYKSIDEVHCPYFQDKIKFNAKGLEHIKFKKKYHARSHDDQYMRFKLFCLAPEVLKLSRTVQGIFSTKTFELKRSNSRNEKILTDSLYYEFIAVLQNTRVKVIVKQVENGPKYFRSIIPFWKINNNSKRILHSGNPELD